MLIRYTAFGLDTPFGPHSNNIRQEQTRPSSLRPTLQPEQIQTILEHTPPYWRTLVIFAAMTALRLGEILGLRWKDIDWDGHRLRVNHSVWRGRLMRPKTEASRKALHIPEALLTILQAHRERSVFTAAEDFVFCRADGASADPDFLRKKVLYPAMDAAGIERFARSHGFHIFRHSAATIVHEETGSVKLAQRQLRRSRSSTTADLYIHPDDEEARKAAETLAGVILRFCPPVAHSGDLKGEKIQ